MKGIAIGILIIALAAFGGFQTYNVYKLNSLQARLTFKVIGLHNMMTKLCKQLSEAGAERDAIDCNAVVGRSSREVGELHGEWFRQLQKEIQASERVR